MAEPSELFDAREWKVIRDGYTGYATRVLTGGEKLAGLIAKLREECDEAEECAALILDGLHLEETLPRFTEELADIVEVCHALGGREHVETTRRRKAEKKGGFEKGLAMRLSERTADGHGNPIEPRIHVPGENT